MRICGPIASDLLPTGRTCSGRYPLYELCGAQPPPASCWDFETVSHFSFLDFQKCAWIGRHARLTMPFSIFSDTHFGCSLNLYKFKAMRCILCWAPEVQYCGKQPPASAVLIVWFYCDHRHRLGVQKSVQTKEPLGPSAGREKVWFLASGPSSRCPIRSAHTMIRVQ